MYRHFNGMNWPCPCERMGELEHSLRYGNPTKSDLLLAASVLSAYGQMVRDPAKKRQKVIAELRKGPNRGQGDA